MDRQSPHDQQAARQGRAAALTGLVVQAALTCVMVVAAAWSHSDAVAATAWHMLGGLPIWLILVIVFGQQETERRETRAAEKLSVGDASTTLLFGELSDEAARARMRLASLVGYGLPAVSLLVGGYLVGMGGTLLWATVRDMSRDAGAANPLPGGNPVGLMFAAGAVSFVAFVTGRWISGCARIPGWQLLRGGASYLMSCFVIAALVAVVAAVAAVTANTQAFRLLAGAVAAIMVLVGGEVLVTCLLDLYRPRKPGELPRPAFDSRLLGLLTAPESLGEVVGELIRYQFGVEISGSWLYRLLRSAITPLIVFAGLVLFALSCIVVVGPDEQGVILRTGAMHKSSLPAGIHLKMPWPLETAVTYPTRRIMQLSVSSGLAARRPQGEAILWSTGDDRLAHIGAEYYPVALAAATAGGGLAVVDAEVVVQYQVDDLPAFLRTSPDPEDMIALVAQQEASRYFGSHDIDFLLSHGRSTGGIELAAGIRRRVDRLGLGLRIVDASITSIQPPGGAVSRAFHTQIAARQERETVIEKARRDAVATLSRVAGSVEIGRRIDAAILDLDSAADQAPHADAEPAARLLARQAAIEGLLNVARGEAAELIHAARGDRWTRAVGEQASRERFASEILAHQSAPRYYRAARFFAVLAAGLADRRKFVVAGDHDDLPVLRMDFADPASAIETLLSE